MSKQKFSRIIQKISLVAERNGINNVYVVGGYPRALIMNNIDDVHDLDIASAWPGEAKKLGSLSASELTEELPETYHRTGTIKFIYNDVELEFQGHHGDLSDNLHIVQEMEKFGISITPLTTNIYSRDFTINTLIQDIYDFNIYDITGMAVSDIKNKVIRAVIDPLISIPKNPLMILRAIRFSLRYGFRIDSYLEEAMNKHRKELNEQLGPERLQIEILKMLKEDYDGTLELMKGFKLEDILINENYDIFEIIKDIDIENFEGDISDLIKERAQ